MPTRRRVGGAVLAALGALGTTAGAYLDWFGGRAADELPLERIYQGDVVETASSYWNSMALPLAVVSLLGVLGALLTSRFVLSLGWLVGVAAMVLWVVMQMRDDAVDLGLADLQTGVWVSTAGLLVMLVGIIAMGRRERASDDDTRESDTSELT